MPGGRTDGRRNLWALCRQSHIIPSGLRCYGIASRFHLRRRPSVIGGLCAADIANLMRGPIAGRLRIGVAAMLARRDFRYKSCDRFEDSVVGFDLFRIERDPP